MSAAAQSGGAQPGGTQSGGAQPGGAQSGGAQSGGAQSGGAQSGGSAAQVLGAGRAWHLAVPAVISVAAFLVIDLLLAALVGRPWGPAYPLTMDALVLARMGPLFFSGVVVWPAMRARGATRVQASIGTLATPVAFAIVSGWRAADFFPPLEAAYYATNPIVVGALGAQVSSAGVGALAYGMWRVHGVRPSGAGSTTSAQDPPGAPSFTPGDSRAGWSWTPVVAIVVGTAVTVVAVLWDGGQHLFYPWVLLYGRLFG